jgi:hypothetical protein
LGIRQQTKPTHRCSDPIFIGKAFCVKQLLLQPFNLILRGQDHASGPSMITPSISTRRTEDCVESIPQFRTAQGVGPSIPHFGQVLSQLWGREQTASIGDGQYPPHASHKNHIRSTCPIKGIAEFVGFPPADLRCLTQGHANSFSCLGISAVAGKKG